MEYETAQRTLADELRCFQQGKLHVSKLYNGERVGGGQAA